MTRKTTRKSKSGKARKTAGSKPKPVAKKTSSLKKSARRPTVRREKPRRSARGGSVRPRASRAVSRRKTVRPRRRASGSGEADYDLAPPLATRGLGPETGGQAGDTEGLSRTELADSESVEELVEEGQAFEAGVVSGVEEAPDADLGGVRTREVPEDDVPVEYRNGRED